MRIYSSQYAPSFPPSGVKLRPSERVADHHRLFAAALADTLLGRALQDFRIRSTRGRGAGSSCRPGRWRFIFVEGWTAGRSLSACTSALLTPGSSSSNSSCASREYFAAWTVLRDAYQSQPFFQHLDPQFRILQPVLIGEDSVLKIAELIAHCCKQRPGKLLLQLFDQPGPN
jgi:hypothetical protein